jgi:hypothetical protein
LTRPLGGQRKRQQQPSHIRLFPYIHSLVMLDL